MSATISNPMRELVAPNYPQNPTCNERLLYGGAGVVVSTGMGALLGYVFTAIIPTIAIGPVGGALFAGTQHLIYEGVDYVMEKMGCNQQQNTILKIAKWAVSFFIPLGVAIAVTTAVGFPVTFTAVILFSAVLLTKNLFPPI